MQLKSLVKELKKGGVTENLSPDVQAIMQEVAVQDSQTGIRNLQSAIKDLGKAKKALGESLDARLSLHTRWQSFVANTIQQWQGYTTQFLEEDGKLKECIAKAKENVTAAKAHFEDLQKETGEAQTLDTSDEEGDMMDPSNKIQEGLEAVQKNLVELKAHTDAQQEELEREKKRKKPRLQPPPSEWAVAASKQYPSQAPFGGAG